MNGSLRLIRGDDCRTMPWKNGGGSTTEIAIGPEGAGLADFDWRVSIALVASDGPFSSFPGIDRTLTVLDGAGIRLHVADRAPLVLRPDSPPLAFPGDATTKAVLVAGPITDFNVMTRRGRFDHRVSHAVLTAPISFAGPLTLIHCRSGSGRVEAAMSEGWLEAGDSALMSSEGRFTPHDRTILFVVDLIAV
jgi:environmental stress-induced protein Ves